MQQQMMMMQMMQGQNPMMGQAMMNSQQMGMQINPQMAMMGQGLIPQPQLINPVAQQIAPVAPVVAQPIERDVNWLKNNLDVFKGYTQNEQKNLMGTLMYSKILGVLGSAQQGLVPKITGMLIDLEVLSIDEIIEILTDDALLRERIEEAQAIIEDEGN